nr:uncharacterized protein LOC109171283 [Ipomoea batatas]
MVNVKETTRPPPAAMFWTAALSSCPAEEKAPPPLSPALPVAATGVSIGKWSFPWPRTKGSSFINGNGCGSSATSQVHQDAMKEMMDAKLQAERAEIDAKLQAERNQMPAQIQAQITSLMDELPRNGMLSTSMPPPQNTQAEHSVNSNDENLGDD